MKKGTGATQSSNEGENFGEGSSIKGKNQKKNIREEEMQDLKLFISCLPKTLTEEEICTALSPHGEILNFEFDIIQQNDGKSRLINAVLTCSSLTMKDKILKSKISLKDHVFKVSQYLSQDQLAAAVESLKNRKIYLKKLRFDFSNKFLEEFFSQFGQIEKAYFSENAKKKKGYKSGYIIFKNEDAIGKIPNDGVMVNGELIEWTCHNKKKESRRKGGIENLECVSKKEFEHFFRPTQKDYYLNREVNGKRDDEENLMLTINTKVGYFASFDFKKFGMDIGGLEEELIGHGEMRELNI